MGHQLENGGKACGYKALALFLYSGFATNLYHLSPYKTAFFRLICSKIAVLFQARNHPTDLRL